MLKILINAYACSPGMGSEPGMAWNWCANLAKYCELYIITEGEFRNNIEKVLPTLPQRGNMHFYYLPIGGNDEARNTKIRKRFKNQGDWRFYIDYARWQKMVLAKAREIVNKTHIDIIHQLNMIGFREPGFLWKIEGIPYIWGPTNAKEAFPVAYLQEAPFKYKLFIFLKNSITRLQLLFSKKVHNAAHRAAYVVAASSDSAHSIKKYLGVTPIIINESGCTPSGEVFIHSKNPKSFDILWVGRILFTKQLTLAIKSVAKAFHDEMKLHIVGSGDIKHYLYEAEKMGIADNCVIHGLVSHDEVQQLMRQSDLFLFTSLSEGTPHVILECMMNGLPILCFDTCGQGDCVTDDVGIKIPLTSPEQSVKDFAEKIEYLYSHRDVLETMSRNCHKRALELSWDNKVKQMVELYKQAL